MTVITAGTRLGPYEVVSRVGAGGMGEVWKARDTRLDRSVAIKVLPAQFAENPRLRVRFEREARTISQLNHPHICTLHDVGESEGIQYLVMELLDGETLADRLLQGPLPLPDVLRFGREIADALDRAHRQGVVHRDLKPANVMLTRSGVKLLDFGLARTASAPPAADSLHSSPSAAMIDATRHKPLTEEGTILGTLQYMAPEQVAGEEADPRSDIFALGVVLYEMASGQRAFQGKTRSSLFGAIVGGEPRPLRELQPLTPPALEHVIQRCLVKDPEQRWQSALDIAQELRWIAEAGSEAGVAAPRIVRRKTRERVAWGLSLVTALAAAGVTWWVVQSRSVPLPTVMASIDLPSGHRAARNDGSAISPDGTMIAAVLADQRAARALWIRPLAESSFRKLDGTARAALPFWSPDSRHVAFFVEGKLVITDVMGGQLQFVCDARQPRGGSWGSDGTIVFGSTGNGPLQKVPYTGGTPVAATQLAPGETSHRWPSFLADGEHFLYVAMKTPGQSPGIYRGSVRDPAERGFVVESATAALAAGNVLLYRRGEALVAQTFDPRSGTVSGPPVPILTGVATNLSLHVSLARNGTLIAQRGPGFIASRLMWIDRHGAQKQAITDPGLFFTPRISHDGGRVAVDRSDPVTRRGDIWIYDLARNVPARLTYSSENESGPGWSPDDRYVYFHEEVLGGTTINRISTGGTGTVDRVETSATEKRLTHVSQDGRWILFDVTGSAEVEDIGALSLHDGTTTMWLATPFNERAGELSPDGRWIVYESNESGRNEIYLRQFPDSVQKWPITSGGGKMPSWRADGREIFYISPDSKMMAVPVTPGDDLRPGTPVTLFDVDVRMHPVRQYDVTADGSRFLLNQLEPRPAESLTVVTHWASRLKR